MMNKPFKGISVPNVARPRPRYLQGAYPEIGDLVSKERATPNGDGSFIQVTGIIVGINKQYGTPIVHWLNEGHAYGMHPTCLTLIKRGK
jgi:hypothetical protein